MSGEPASLDDADPSAQQLFLGAPNKLYFVDKTENNPLQVNGHPAWASEVDIGTWQVRAMDIRTNSFCAGGTVLGDGTWLNVGGNQAVIAGGVSAGEGNADAQSGNNQYKDADGRNAVRTLVPSNDGKAEWVDDQANYMPHERWYPTLETLEDGSAIIFGGCQNGGYVNDPGQDNPTYEYFPKRGGLTELNILKRTVPVNLFPLVWLLPSGNIFIQSGWEAVIFDYKNNVEYPIANIPDAVRVYPASAATAALPMTPGNNWTSSILFCGGTNLQNDQWTPPTRKIVEVPTERSCVKIQPDVDVQWYPDDFLDAGRSMGNFINLPDGRLFLVNGCGLGTAGYGNESWAIGQSYGDDPQYQAWYYSGDNKSGQKWAKAGAPATIPRMYHSTAVLLPDASVLIAGSNPNADFVSADNPPTTPNPTYKYFSDTSMEVFYPDYYDQPRPAPAGMPTNITYGGPSFDVELSKADLGDTTANIARTKAVIIRTGFSTHAMNMGQRHIELQTSFTTNDLGGATLHVAQLPPNPAILVPGPALFFIVVNGIPSNASWIMVGDGKIGQQTLLPTSELPPSTWSQDVADQAAQLNIQ